MTTSEIEDALEREKAADSELRRKIAANPKWQALIEAQQKEEADLARRYMEERAQILRDLVPFIEVAQRLAAAGRIDDAHLVVEQAGFQRGVKYVLDFINSLE